MCDNLAFLVADTSASESIGYFVGYSIGILALLAGLIKCYRISRRPTTNTLCVLSLGLLLFALLFSASTSPWIESLAMSLLSLFARFILLLASIIVAIIGLVEYQNNRENYTQGRAQAIWGVLLSTTFLALLSRYLILDLYTFGGLDQDVVVDSAEGASGHVDSQWFRELNFRFKAPDASWLPMDAESVNPNACLVVYHSKPKVLFAIIAEATGIENSMDTQALCKLSQANVKSASKTVEIKNEREVVLNGITGISYQLTAQLGRQEYHYTNWVTTHNGISYQLTAFSEKNGKQFLQTHAEDLFSGFHILDKDLVIHNPGVQLVEHHQCPEFGYSVDFRHVPDWVAVPDYSASPNLIDFYVEKTLERNTVAYSVVPIELPVIDAEPVHLMKRILERNFVFKNISQLLRTPTPIHFKELEGCEVAGATQLVQDPYKLLMRMVKNRTHAYLLIGWWPQELSQGKATVEEAMEAFQVIPHSGAPVERLGIANASQAALVYNDLGIDEYNRSELSRATSYFVKSLEYNPDPVVLQNLLNTYQEQGNRDAALDALETRPDLVTKTPELLALKAELLAAKGEIGRALKSYRTLFSKGYDNENELLNFLNVAVEHQKYSKAISVTELFLRRSPSDRVQRWLASLYNQKGNPERAVELLKELYESDQSDYENAYSLAEIYFSMEQYSACLEICDDLVHRNKKTLDVYLLKGASEYSLEWHVKAQDTFQEVLKLDENNPEAKEYLRYISAFLGKGDRSQISTPIKPVSIPEEVQRMLDAVNDDSLTDESKYGAVEQYHVTGISYEALDHKKMTTYRRIQVLSTNGVNNFSTLTVSFDPLIERIYVNDLSVYNDSGQLVSKGSNDDYYVLDDSDSAMATQERLLYIPIPNLKPSHTVEIAYTKEDLSAPDEFGFYDRFLTSIAPLKMSVVFFAGDHSKVKFAASKARTKIANPSLIIGYAKTPLVYQIEPLQRPAEYFLPMVLIADRGKNWQTLAEEYLERIAPKLALEDEIRKTAREVTAGVDNRQQKIALLAGYVQKECTYKALEFGVRSSIPHTASTTKKNGYGDCKDHSVLLIQLLRAVGIEANLALIKSGGPLAKAFPSLEQFDHMIVHIPGGNKDGSDLFVDCTSKDTIPFLPITSGLNRKKALVLDKENPRIIETPDYRGSKAEFLVQRTIRIPQDQNEPTENLVIKERLTLNPFCSSSFRSYLRAFEPKQRRRAFNDLMSQQTKLRIEKFDVENLEAPMEDLILDYVYKVPGALHRFSKSPGEDRFVGTLPTVIEDYLLVYELEEPRKTPFALTLPVRVKTITRLQVQPPSRVDKLDLMGRSKSNNKFFDWNISSERLGEEFLIEAHIERHRGKYKADSFSEFIDETKTVSKALKSSLIINSP